MIPPCNNELWFTLLYCVLTWLGLTLAYWLADSLKRWRNAMACGLTELVLASVLAMLSSIAAAQLGTGLLMSGGFQLVGLIISAMAVSRVFQMQSWPRTWLAAVLVLLVYLLLGWLLAWVMQGLQQSDFVIAN